MFFLLEGRVDTFLQSPSIETDQSSSMIRIDRSFRTNCRWSALLFLVVVGMADTGTTKFSIFHLLLVDSFTASSSPPSIAKKFKFPTAKMTSSDSTWSVPLPLLTDERQIYTNSMPCSSFLRQAFANVVDSSEFLIPIDNTNYDQGQHVVATCEIPAMNHVQVSLQLSKDNKYLSQKNAWTSCQLVIMKEQNFNNDSCGDSAAVSKQDFGFICAKFYDSWKQNDEQSLSSMFDMQPLQRIVLQHYNLQESQNSASMDTGYVPDMKQNLMDHYMMKDDKHVLDTLRQQGYATLDLPEYFQTTRHTHEQLSAYLASTTGQSSNVRTDKVHFLSYTEAQEVGMQAQYDCMTSLASFFNRLHRPDDRTAQKEHSTLSPASQSQPFTIPKRLQLAEYRTGDFYKAHSDNSLSAAARDPRETTEANQQPQYRRRNFREITCILYCLSTEWKKEDGGALRIYPHSQDFVNVDQATQECLFVDILPQNGRLLIFDSKLVHSVQPNLSSDKVRRALTLWISRPTTAEIAGSTYCA